MSRQQQVDRQILRIALPAIGENFLQMLMGMVDSYLVAQLGLVAVSGVSVAGNIITIYQAIFIALGAAVVSLLSKSMGQKDQKAIARQATESIKVTVLLSLVLGTLSLCFGKELIALLGVETAVAAAGGLYLALVGGSILLLGLMTTFGALVRVAHNPRVPMYVSLLTNVLNALLSSILIFVFGLGIAGAALGTVLSRLLGTYLLWRQVQLPFAPFRWGLDRDLLSLALPAAGERLMMEVLTQFNYMPAFGIATATVMLVAKSLGQNDWQGIKQITSRSFWLSFLSMFPLALTIFLFGSPLTALYTKDSGAIAASLSVILFSLLGTPLTAGTVIYTAVWQGLGNARLPFYATTIGMWVIRIGSGYLMGVILGWGLPGIWAGTLLDNGFRWFFLKTLYHRKWKE